MNNSPDISAGNPDQTGTESPDETDIDDTLTRDKAKHLNLDMVFPAFTMLSSDTPEPAIETAATADTAPSTRGEIQTAFREVFGEPAEQYLDPDQIKEDELVSQDGTVSWLPDDMAPSDYDTAAYEPADNWHFDTARYGGELRGKETIREVYILERNGGETWCAASSDRVEKIVDFTGLSEPQLLTLAEINTNDGNENPPIRFDLTVGSLYLNPVHMTDGEVDVI